MEANKTERAFQLTERQAILILTTEGFASVAVQIILMRQLTPFVGSNALVNSIIIAVYLGALAMSYAVGGNVQKAQSSRLQRNLLFAGCALGIGVSYPVTSLFFEISASVLDNPLVALAIYLVVVVGPMVYVLGQTVPLLTNFVKRERVAKVTGDSFNRSTWGNAFGSLATGLIILLYFGIGWAVFLNALILLVITLFLTYRLHDRKTAIHAMIAIVAIFGLNVVNEESHFITTTPYSNYRVVQNNNEVRVLEINKSPASSLNAKGEAADYMEHIKHVMFDDLNLVDSNILVLGAGGFTLSHQGDNGNTITYVDIDPAIQKVAEEHFLGQPIKGNFVSTDARTFVRNAKSASYDAVVIDLYTNLATIPWHVATGEFYTEIRDIVTNDGYVFLNVIGYPWMDDPYSKRIDNTIRMVFGNCRVNAGTYENRPTNLVYGCKKDISNENDGTIYSDVNSRGTHDAYVLSIRKEQGGDS